MFPNECGGPLVSLDGKVVGINIARGGRVDSYAMPAAETFEVFLQLRAGNLGPSPDYLSRLSLSEINRKLADLSGKLQSNEKTVQESTLKIETLREEIEKLEKARIERQKVEKAKPHRKRL